MPGQAWAGPGWDHAKFFLNVSHTKNKANIFLNVAKHWLAGMALGWHGGWLWALLWALLGAVGALWVVGWWDEVGNL